VQRLWYHLLPLRGKTEKFAKGRDKFPAAPGEKFCPAGRENFSCLAAGEI
jgi:hypothetical protein